MRITNNVREIFDYAKLKSHNHNIDEFGTKDNPSIWKRSLSKLSYEEAFKLIESNDPIWSINFREHGPAGPCYEFNGTNIGNIDIYGAVFIWIYVDIKEAIEIFEKYNIKYE